MLVLTSAAAACAPVPARVPSPPVTVPMRPHVVERAAPDDRLCAGLVATVDAWSSAFAALRTDASGEGRWRGRPLDPQLGDCIVDGTSRITASYACTPSDAWDGRRKAVEAKFRLVEDAVDRCLARPVWYPRRWAKAPAVELAGGERQQLWRDQGAWPRPALQIKIEEDYDRPGSWTLRLVAYTMR